MYCKIRNDLRTKFVVKVWADLSQYKANVDVSSLLVNVP